MTFNLDQLQGAGIASAIIAALQTLKYFFTDKDKELDVSLEEKRLAIQLDEQNALQEERLIPHFKSQLDLMQKELVSVKADLALANKQNSETGAALAVSLSKAQILEEQMNRLKAELASAYEIINQQKLTIADLKAQIPPDRLKYIT